MSEIIRVNGLSKFGLVHNRISVINYIPESYVYDEKVGLYVNWKVRDVHMKSRIVEGPFKVKYEEHGEMRTKHRYKIIALPEMLCGPSPEIMKFLEDCKYYGTIHSIINMHTPPLEVYEKMEQTAKKIYLERKNENDGDNPTSNNGFATFKLGEFGEGESATFLEKIQIAFAEGLAKFFKRSYVNMKKPYEPAVAEDWGPNSPDPWDVDDVDKSMKIIERKSEGLYVSDYWPWFVYDPDVVKPFWKRIYKMLGYKKLKITTVTCDLDVKQYQELKKIREEEVFEIQESIRIFMPDVRSL